MPNRLARESSPYLQQHAHNPVDWYPWGPEAFARARLEDKPILLSVGYSACHWCHVMAHESFEDEAIARQMNEGFICIKVDREERPDVDAIYMQAVQAQTGRGGWPMTVFLTPEGKPFFGGTYFPPEDRGGMPGFPRVLHAIADIYRNRKGEAVQSAEQLTAHLRSGVMASQGSEPLTSEVLQRAYQGLKEEFDQEHGGFGQAPKFPQPMALEFLLRSFLRTKDTEALAMADFTLERMARGGIYDQLGGGFCRYSVDAEWAIPHFEKMLYDNGP
ncbi:MAG: thioredoxin domain-containing protein, partial [Chloroflexi bacterium]|nr:thioredoxin domain-containing protein [Chloroflexota bacterium]